MYKTPNSTSKKFLSHFQFPTHNHLKTLFQLCNRNHHRLLHITGIESGGGGFKIKIRSGGAAADDQLTPVPGERPHRIALCMRSSSWGIPLIDAIQEQMTNGCENICSEANTRV